MKTANELEHAPADRLFIRLGREELEELLNQLDQASQTQDSYPKRAPRSRYRTFNAELWTAVPPGKQPTAPVRVATRNISVGGLSFLYHQMLAIGQRVVIRLPMSANGHLEASAEVVRCRYLKVGVHEVAVKFVKVARKASGATT